jgi:phosphoribosyl-AMP cyclohydrolase / phosphoribosyl-ATP pyrophosphohydrolase
MSTAEIGLSENRIEGKNNMMDLKFDEKGLIPVVVQDYYTKQVLTVAYMNRESLAITMREGRTCFFSRSRQELWRKGETSGNTQEVVTITADCDKDALVIQVIKNGPACHTGADSCFFEPVYQSQTVPAFSVDALYDMIRDRKENPKPGSYTNYLFDKGIEKILKKVGEESTEVVIAAARDKREEVVYEVSDLAYHLMVMMVETGVKPEDIVKELAGRHVIDEKV